MTDKIVTTYFLDNRYYYVKNYQRYQIVSEWCKQNGVTIDLNSAVAGGYSFAIHNPEQRAWFLLKWK